MFVIEFTVGETLIVHYQRPIHPGGIAEWSWGPADGTFLVPISEALALTMIARPDATWKVCCE